MFDSHSSVSMTRHVISLMLWFIAKEKPKVHHVETAKMLTDKCGNWGQTAYFLLPDSDSTNEMASALETLSRKTKATPYRP